MRINGEELQTLGVFPTMMTVPDCVVIGSNKLGRGHGEAKFYISSKEDMYAFYGSEKFHARCFLLKSDLIAYMKAIKNEYMEPSQDYAKKEKFPALWQKRMNMILGLEDVIFFTANDQHQIAGPRGYINSDDKGYQIIREIALPLVSYIYVEKVGLESDPLYYWKLFVDFDAIWEKQNGPLVFSYGKQKDKDEPKPKESKKELEKRKEISRAREGQGKYREQLLEQCRYCPFTMIADERLLIASHIKPWAASEDNEKIDPYNGYMLSPLYDKLFDRGFITFTESRHLILSEFISPFTWKQIGLKNDTFIKALPMDDKRAEYLEFHHDAVFKGSYDFTELRSTKAPRKYYPSYEASMVAEAPAEYKSGLRSPGGGRQLMLKENVVVCEKCGKEYAQSTESQKEGHRFKGEDKCPYCGNVRTESMEREFHNRRLD